MGVAAGRVFAFQNEVRRREVEVPDEGRVLGGEDPLPIDNLN